ncbi:hypothetical protein FQA39_LY18437 [Lamprigera yunnana]|nr:hypothetical protein FQA39_LY18437 [Lamprigera yunnana]
MYDYLLKNDNLLGQIQSSNKGAKMLELALENDRIQPNTDKISETEEFSYCEPSEPWSDVSDDLDPTYRPEEAKIERTLNWLQSEDFSTNTEKENRSNSKEQRNDNEHEDFELSNGSSIISYIDPISISVTELQIDVPSSNTHRKDITNTNLSVESDGPSNEFQKNNVNANQQLEVNVPTYTEFQKDIVNTNQPVHPQPSSSKNSTDRYIDETRSKQKKRIICKFCRISVTNFERHLCRHHLDEIEVKDYLKFPKNTKEEDITNTNLSVESDGPSNEFQKNNVNANQQLEVNVPTYTEFQKDIVNTNQPVHPQPSSSKNSTDRYIDETRSKQKKRIICKFCRISVTNFERHLCRHHLDEIEVKDYLKFPKNTKEGRQMRRNILALLSKMASDNIGFLARKDSLIRHFGEFYLKKHKRAQISHACSNKMRECSRLLIEMRRRTGNPNFSFVQLLNPTLFDDVVLCAKTISGYDDTRKTYKAPSLALHLGTTLQHMCELTTHLLLKKHTEFKCTNYEGRLKEVKRFRFLVQSQWSNEVASLALKDLAEKKWNTLTMLPLTQDIIKFKEHILENAEENFALLRNDRTNTTAFKKLVDVSLALTILFNRRRIGDVQYVETETYLKNFYASNQTEFIEQLTESEKALTTKYKRVVAGGKGSRAIVILFPPNVQNYINLLLQIRQESEIVPLQNKYLFAYPGVTDQWVRGDIVLKKFANSCKIEHPEAMTSNRLRKQIATLMQIINLDKTEYSQFARFMGHTEKTHQEYYQITQDAFQTAKVAKLLTLFDKGEGH